MEHPDNIMDLLTHFMEVRSILTAAELDLFTTIEKNVYTANALAEKEKLDPRATTRLLDSLVCIDLLEKRGDAYTVTDRGARLSSEHPQTELPMILHLNGLWDTWSHLTETVRTGHNVKMDDAVHKNQDRQRAFIGAMHVVGRTLADEIAESWDLAPFSKLLDIGGASGTYTLAFLRKNPKMTAVLFDLEPVIPLARERLKEEAYLDRVSLVSGDLNADEFPAGCDLALLSAIIHMNSPEQNADLYRRIYHALNPGGALLIRDHVMDESRIHPPSGAFFALNMLVNTMGGDTYTFEEIRTALSNCGFVDIELARKGENMDCLVEARKPE